MERNQPLISSLDSIPTPFYAVDLRALEKNLQVLDRVQRETGTKILLALKAFAMFSAFPLLREVLHGICASSVNEARLGREEFGKEVHSFSAAYKAEDLGHLLEYSDHIIFNSFNQWKIHEKITAPFLGKKELGFRINPEHSENATPIYDPCAPYSRLGITKRIFDEETGGILPGGVEGLHFHTLCEQDSFALERTFRAFEKGFSSYFKQMKWLNMGGGHHITRPGYDVDHLCRLLNSIKEKYDLQLYLEPGEAVALNCGWFVTTVLDIIENEKKIAILDSSAPCHMPDVLEMPYRPHITGSGPEEEKPFSYILGGMSCLAGDVMGRYSFDRPLEVGQRLVFTDMAIYSMVKNNTFNGIFLPSIVLFDSENETILHRREFGYEDFKGRLS